MAEGRGVEWEGPGKSKIQVEEQVEGEVRLVESKRCRMQSAECRREWRLEKKVEGKREMSRHLGKSQTPLAQTRPDTLISCPSVLACAGPGQD